MKGKSEIRIRFAATAIIWGFGTGMLALCIPLVGMTGTPLLPLAVIVGAAVSTVVIWVNSANSPHQPFLTSSMQQLEQRVANLEIIASDRELDLDNKIKRLESKD